MDHDPITASRPDPGRFTRHRGPVTCVASVPGRNAALSCGYDSAVAYVDLDTGAIELLGYHAHLVNSVVVNAAGTLAASSSSDYTVCIWDLRSRRPRQLLRGHHDDVNAFCFVDERTGASVSHDHRVYVWDLETGAVLRVLEGHRKYAMSVDAAHGRIYSSGDDMTLRQWDAASGAQLRCWGPFDDESDSCAIDPRRGRIVLGSDDGCVRVFDTETGEQVGEVRAHSSGVKRVCVCPRSGDILSAAYDQRLRVWRADDLSERAQLRGMPSVWERSLNWSSDGRHILGGTFDGTVVEWELARADARPRELGLDGLDAERPGNVCINDLSSTPTQTAFVSDDGLIRVGQGDRVDAVIEPLGGRVLMNAVTCHERSGRVLAGAHDQSLHLLEREREGWRARARIELGEGPINCVRVSDHASTPGHAFVACYSGAIVELDAGGALVARHRLHRGAVKALRLHPREAIGVSCSADGELLSWTHGGQILGRFRGHVMIADDVDLDPSGELVATVSRDFTLKVYELASQRLEATFFLGQRSPKSTCFWSRDVVLIGDYWGTLSRFDLRTGELRSAQIAGNGLSSMSRCGALVHVASYDGTLQLVDPDTLVVEASLRAMHQRVTDTTVAQLLEVR